MFTCPFTQAAVSALGYDRLQGWASREKLLFCHVLYIWYHQTSWGNDPFLLLPGITFSPAYYLLRKRLSLVQLSSTLIASTPSNFLMHKNINKNSQNQLLLITKILLPSPIPFLFSCHCLALQCVQSTSGRSLKYFAIIVDNHNNTQGQQKKEKYLGQQYTKFSKLHCKRFGKWCDTLQISWFLLISINYFFINGTLQNLFNRSSVNNCKLLNISQNICIIPLKKVQNSCSKSISIYICRLAQCLVAYYI